MLDRNKNKHKIQINKALQTVNNIVKPTAEIKQTLQNTYKDANIDRTDKIHCKICIIAETVMDTDVGQQFIISQYNRDSKTNNYRSPYSNTYFPVNTEEAFIPSPLLRDLQEKGNLLFSEYARMYYGQQGCFANFYVFETEEGLNFAFFIKKVYKDPQCYGVWCSSNIIEIRGDPSKSVSYKLQTSVIYELNVLNEETQSLIEVYGSTKKNRVQSKRWLPEYEIDEFHLLMTGKLVEEVETMLRQQIQCVFVAKTKDIIFKTRFINSKEDQNQRKKRAKQLMKMRPECNRVVE